MLLFQKKFSFFISRCTSFSVIHVSIDIKRGSQWGVGLYGYRLKFLIFYGYIGEFVFSYGQQKS